MDCENCKKQADLLRQALDVLQEGCSHIAWPGTGLMEVKIKAQSLIPALEKALEKVK